MSKVLFTPAQAMKAQRGSRDIDSSTLSLVSSLDGDEWSTPRPAALLRGNAITREQHNRVSRKLHVSDIGPAVVGAGCALFVVAPP